MAALSARANLRLNSAYAKSTARSYNQMFKNFLAFCVYASCNIHCVSIHVLLVFLEYLTFNSISYSGITNHLSAIKATMCNLGLDVSAFADPTIRVFTRSLLRSRPLNPHIKSIIDISMLKKIVSQCDRTYLGVVYKAAFLLSFFSFLRISNLVPHSISSFDPLKQLARGPS